MASKIGFDLYTRSTCTRVYTVCLVFEFLKKKEEVGYFFKRIYLRIKTEVFITLYFDLIKTQIKTMMAKQLDSFEKAQKASRLKRLHNRDGQI